MGLQVGRFWEHIGSELEVLVPSWVQVGRSWAYVGASWGYVGPSWGYVGAKLGLCWSMFGHLGSNLKVLETIWRVLVESIRKP